MTVALFPHMKAPRWTVVDVFKLTVTDMKRVSRVVAWANNTIVNPTYHSFPNEQFTDDLRPPIIRILGNAKIQRKSLIITNRVMQMHHIAH